MLLTCWDLGLALIWLAKMNSKDQLEGITHTMHGRVWSPRWA